MSGAEKSLEEGVNGGTANIGCLVLMMPVDHVLAMMGVLTTRPLQESR